MIPSGLVSYFVATTPLGGPVVPDVYIIPTPPLGSSRSTSGSVSAPSISRSKSQSMPLSALPSSTTVDRSSGQRSRTDSSASRRSSWTMAQYGVGVGEDVGQRVPRCDVLTGTEWAPMKMMPRWAQRNSGRFGSSRATFSPGRTPSSRRPLAARWAYDRTSRQGTSSSFHFNQVASGWSATRLRIVCSMGP